MTPNEPPRAVMLARRVLPIAAYVAELREDKDVVAARLRHRLGVRVVPVPVPLARGETEEGYEQRFLAAYPLYKNAGDQDSANGERASRFLFARRVAREYQKRARTKDRPSSPYKTPPEPYVRNTQRLVELDQFRKDHRLGRLASYKELTTEEKLERFGVPVVPIFVPLARGESAQQYEARFVEWLETKMRLTLDEVRRKSTRATERTYRIHFASLNGQGVECFAKRERDEGDDGDNDEEEDRAEAPLKKPRGEDNAFARVKCSAAAASEKSVDACMACACDTCLLRALMLGAESAARREQALASTCACPRKRRRVLPPQDAVVLDLTLDDEGASDGEVIEVDTSASDSDDLSEQIPRPDDALEDRLYAQFAELNEHIELNQKALDTVEEELARAPPANVQGMTTLHEENQEMRALIQEECVKRTALLALLVVCVWRDDRRALDRMVDDPAPSDVAHVQRRSYERFVTLANELAAVREKGTEPVGDRIKEKRTATSAVRRRVDELKAQRRQQLRVLVQIDAKLRRGVARLLDACGGVPHLMEKM